MKLRRTKKLCHFWATLYVRLDFPPCLIDFDNDSSGAQASVSWAGPKSG